MAVVDQAPVELVDRFGQRVWPGAALGNRRHCDAPYHWYWVLDLDDPRYNVHGSQPGLGRAALLPSALAAGIGSTTLGYARSWLA